MSGGSIGASALVGVASGGPREAMAGPTYDTLTHKPGVNAEGAVDNGTELGGRLEIAGFDLNLGRLERISSTGGTERYGGTFDEPRYLKDDTPLRLRILRRNGQIVGTLSRPSGKYGKLGFMLFSGSGRRAKQARHSLVPDSRWVDSSYSFDTPETGLPTDSGISRLSSIVSDESTDASLTSSSSSDDCDDADDSEAADGEDHGTLDEISWSGSMSKRASDGACEDKEMSWDVIAGINASNDSTYCYDEIRDWNRWRFNLHFSDPPGNMLEGCDWENDSYDARPWNFRFEIKKNDNKISLEEPEPNDGEGDDDNLEYKLLLDLIGSTKYGGVPAAIGEYILESQKGTNVENDPETIVWDASLDGDADDMQQVEDDEAKSVQTSAKIDNGYYDDDYYSVDFFPEYTFAYYERRASGNCCWEYDTKIKTTAPSNDKAIGFYQSIPR
jgi:hypothetical protein